MKVSKIKPVPKYILKKIIRYDKSSYYTRNDNSRFYSYLSKNDGELVKITVAIKNHKGKIFVKQVAIHGLRSDKCFVKDLVYYTIAGYVVGWHEEGLSRYPNRYEDGRWYYAEDKYFDPFAPVVNREYLDNFPKYRYSAVNLYRGVNVLKYLRYYEKYPQIEYLTKAGFTGYIFSVQILREIGKNKRFCKWLMQNRKEIIRNGYYVDVILRAFKTGKSLDSLQSYRIHRMRLFKEAELKELREFFKPDLERFVNYLNSQHITPYTYHDYLAACQYLGLDMTESKNRYPHDFRRWHDIRTDEYATAKAMKDEEERKALYDRFSAVAEKYTGLQYSRSPEFVAILPFSPADLVREGEALHHCVGRMNYDRKFAREESLIFFIRAKASPDTPLVTVEYSLSTKKLLQCYGDNDGKPADDVLEFVNKRWLPYANRKIKKLKEAI